MLESLTSLLTLTVLEVVLSIDNLVVIAVLVGKLPKDRQARARYVGMTLALVPRLVLLVFIGWIIGLTEPMFYRLRPRRLGQGPDPRRSAGCS